MGTNAPYHSTKVTLLISRNVVCPVHHFPERRFAEEQHSFFFRGFLDLRGRAAVENHGSDTVGEVEKFRDRGAAVEAGAVALEAARSFAELLVRGSRCGSRPDSTRNESGYFTSCRQ